MTNPPLNNFGHNSSRAYNLTERRARSAYVEEYFYSYGTETVMQQGLTTSPYQEYPARRAQRPGLLKRPQMLFMLALAAVDLVSVWIAFALGHWLLHRDPNVIIGPFSEFLPLPMIQSILLFFLFFSQRMYQRRRPIAHLDETYRVITLSTLSTLLSIALVSLLLRDFTYHRMFIVYAWIFSIGLLTVGRMIHAQIQWQAQSRGIGEDRVLLIGAGEVGQMIIQKIMSNPQLGYRMVGVIDSRGTRLGLGVPVLGTFADIPAVIDAYAVDEVIIGLPESTHQEIVGIISLCEREKVGIRVFPDVFQIMASEVTIGELGGLPLLTMRDVALQGWRLTLKRGMDILFSAVGLILLSPFLLLIALLIKLDSPGSVFYVQERMGLDAKPFRMLKYRSMRQDAEQSGPGWTTEDDPRRTKLGSLIRRFNIDELPQLINVLMGDMSLVGPRPERPVYVEQFRQQIPRYMDRHREKAGMTGWAQVNGMRGDTSIVERTKYDLWYIENWSLALDIKIIIRTIVQTIVGRDNNAY
jgi:exopolysaccharide biosynthesis polyprenyl glycosylphosphotransferase